MKTITIYISIIFILLFSTENCLSQNYEDSLKSRLSLSEDTNKIITLNKLGLFYCEKNDSITYNYANQAISLSDKLNYPKGKSDALNIKGIVCDVLGQYDSALIYYSLSLKIALQIKNSSLAANVYNNIGLVFWNKGDYQKAISAYFLALRINENGKNKKSTANVLSNIGLIYNDIGKFNHALIYHFKAYELRKELNDDYGIGVSLTNIGLAYEELNNYDLALEYFLKSVDFKKKTDDLYGLAIVYNNLGIVYGKRGNGNEALKYYLSAITIRKELNDNYGLITTYNNLAELYRTRKDLKSSLVYSLKSLELVEELDSKTKFKKVYQFLSLIYRDLGDYKNAFIYSEKTSLLKDTIYSLESSRSMSEMQTKYETEKKEQEIKIQAVEIETQKSKNKAQIILFISLFLVITTVFISMFYRFKQRQKLKLTEETNRQEKMRFKAVIDSEEKERIRVAKELHDGLGQLLSSAKLNISSLEDSIPKEDEYLLKNSLSIIDDAVNEVRTISHNMMPTALMNYDIVKAISVLTGKINETGLIAVKFDSTNFNLTLPKETEITMYRIVQEIVNNMIKHAQTPGIDIVLSNQNEEIKLFIKDYGKGFNTAEIKHSSGIGWQNIYSRVAMLNGKIVVDSQPEKGTRITVTFTL